MIDPQKKQKLFYSRAQHQIKQIQFSCREVIALSQQLALFAQDVAQSQLNSRKIQFLKTQIKDKLRQFATNIDEVYKILDKKVIILSRQINNELKNKTNVSTSNSEYTNNSLNKSHIRQKETHRSIERTQPQQSFEQDRLFSDTLNPRITQLQARITEYEQREALLNAKIKDLKSKNQNLLEEFNRLSTASNKKINELSFQLNNRHEKQKDSFSSVDSNQVFRKKNQQKPLRPILSFNSAQELGSSVTNDKNRPILYSEADEFFQFQFDEKKSIKKEEKTKSLAFGCMPTKQKPQTAQTLSLTPPKLAGSQVQNLDKHDKSRRFDLLLNRLRDSQASIQKKMPQKATENVEQFQSVFSQNIVKRYQI